MLRSRDLVPGLGLGLGLLLSVTCSGAFAAGAAARVTAERLTKAEKEPAQWMTYGGTYSEQRFSPLKKIDSGNVGSLGLRWYADYETNQNQHGSPLYIDGVIYVSTARNVVHAFDAKTGRQLWKYNPMIQGPRLRSNLGLVNRGIAAWNGKIIMGTLDARLVAIDAKTGKAVWDVDTVPASLGLGDMADKYSITMAPRVAKGLAFIGGSGGEFGVRGWIAAYDVETGKEVWRFWTVPGDPSKGFESKALEAAAKTWDGEWWTIAGGGGTVWDAAVYDPVTDLLYFGTGNPTPWNSRARTPSVGDNLYAASIVAVRPDTGEYVWHYQETPGDSWDYDAVSPMMTADLTLNGQKQHVLIQPSKNGFLYVLDAKSGKLLSADPFTEVNWATGVDLKTGRPIEVPGSRYEKEPWNVAPGAPGGHTWHPNAYSPVTGLVYIPTWENYGTMADLPKESQPVPGRFSIGVSFGANVDRATLKPNNKRADLGWLRAWDPVKREVVWQTEQGPRATSGVLATGGNLVFMGNGPGKAIKAYDAKTGKELWSFDAKTAVLAAPISYELDGRQYIAASVGGTAQGGYFAPTYARMLVFATGGKAVLPEPAPYTPPALNPPPSTASADVIAHGEQAYNANCSVCHGAGGLQARTSFPNLTVSALLYSQAGFDQVVLQGARADKGMGSFAKELKPQNTVAVREYLIARANALKNAPPAGPGGRPAAAAPPPPPRADTGHTE
jgi:PQQ-dependent dehydrogenase (methanol/ethanol family)